jgi:cbb3-type cytochrome oxidase subunit 3
MLERIKEIFDFAAKFGLNLPAAYDNDKKGPSVSLLFAHISFYLAIVSISLLIYKDRLAGTVAAMAMAGLYFVFYMLRKLNKAKVDIKNQSFDLENDEKDTSK